MNLNDFGHVSIVFEYDMMCAHVYHVKYFNFSNIHIRIRQLGNFNIRRMSNAVKLFEIRQHSNSNLNFVTSLVSSHKHYNCQS